LLAFAAAPIEEMVAGGGGGGGGGGDANGYGSIGLGAPGKALKE
jgi:hypothetical protein